MRSTRGLIAAIAAAMAAGCGSGGEVVPLSVPAMQVTTEVFSESILHHVELTVASDHLPALVPFGEERVPARLVYDGVTLEDVGLRLKGGRGSARPLSNKASFWIKTNEFVSGQKLHGVKKFTLDNEVQDPSLLAAHVGYEVFRRAGLPVRRTAFARVTFNGVFFGVYLVAEAIDSDFVKRWFPDSGGNLYEGDEVDVTEPEKMELETNEAENDRSDLEALRDLLLSADDDTMLASLSDHVDVDAFFRYEAAEALCNHWDGYTGINRLGDPGKPKNYYVYASPLRGIVWIPHGIDQILGYPGADVLGPPIPSAVLAARLHATAMGRERFAAAVRELLDSAWDEAALVASLEAVVPLIEGSVAECRRVGNPSLTGWRNEVARVRAFVLQRAQNVLDELD